MLSIDVIGLGKRAESPIYGMACAQDLDPCHFSICDARSDQRNRRKHQTKSRHTHGRCRRRDFADEELLFHGRRWLRRSAPVCAAAPIRS